jgi:hypothetical protein
MERYRRDAIMRTDELIWEGVEADKAELNAATQIVTTARSPTAACAWTSAPPMSVR